MGTAPGHRHPLLRLRTAVSLSLLAGTLALTASPASAENTSAENSADVVDGLVVRYDLDQESGATATDTSGHGRDGTLAGDASWSDGALTLGGGNGHVRLPNNVLAGLTQITVSADVYLDPAQATPYMIWALGNTDSGGVGNGYLFATGNAFRTSIASGNWSTEQTVTSSANLRRGVWSSISYTLDANGEAGEYLNGVRVATKSGVTLKPGDLGGGTTTANYLAGRCTARTSTCRAGSATSGSTTGH